jgi:hypothetical protein
MEALQFLHIREMEASSSCKARCCSIAVLVYYDAEAWVFLHSMVLGARVVLLSTALPIFVSA